MLIGLTGVARAGKDTVADILVEEFEFTKISPADLVRAVALGADPWIPLETDREVEGNRIFHEWYPLSGLVAHYGWERTKDFPEVRKFLQRLGTEGGRKVLGEGVWIDALMATLEPGKSYVNASARFANEAAPILAAGGEVWRIVRDGYDALDHDSDAGLPESLITRTLYNNWGLDTLRQVVRNLIANPIRVSPSYPPGLPKPDSEEC